MLAKITLTCQSGLTGYMIGFRDDWFRFPMPKTSPEQHRPPRFELIAGNVCLDFINTLDNRPGGHPKELLPSYIDLVHFAQDSGILTPREAKNLVEHARAKPEQAQSAVQKAVELREAMYEVFMAIVERGTVPAPPLALLNGYIKEAAAHAVLQPVDRRFAWRFDDLSSLASPRWRIARAAAELLASDQLSLIRTCSSETCQWLFIDTSKNHHRRWCSMKVCGNRAKVRRFYAKRK